MFIVKYALKSIRRSIGRNILIGIIVFIIAVSACVAMSIQQAAQTAASNSLKGMNITAQINIDRGYVYDKASENTGSTDMSVLMPEISELNKEYALDLSDMEEYRDIKKAGTDESIVKDYYYNASISINGDSIEKYDLTASASNTAATEAAVTVESPTDPAGNVVEMPQMPVMEQPQAMEQSGDFSLVGYSSYQAMEDFGEDDEESTCTMKEGEIFADNTSEYVCLVEESLATFNSLSVNDVITLVNPNNEEETYDLTIVGIYKNSSSSSVDGVDPPNTIITSYAVVKDIETNSETVNSTASTAATADSDDDENEDALVSKFTGTFIFGSVDDYNQFKEEVKAKAESAGLDGDLYIVTSSDIASFKAGLKPLENLKSFATTFLYLTLAIGAIVLIVISVISIRDRKYEIGALAAMGLKKMKLSMLFMIEVLAVTLIAILIGATIGSVASVPVTNYLLQSQVEQQEMEDQASIQQPQMPGGGSQERPEDGEVIGKVNYLTQVGFSVDFMVILKMLLIGIGLSVVSGFTSILFILRYDPKQILASRD
ncbi:MAG: ABC transporter permease [Ruminococcus sp.]|nr:ABC transporter permease [Ruminococcus sp.]